MQGNFSIDKLHPQYSHVILFASYVGMYLSKWIKKLTGYTLTLTGVDHLCSSIMNSFNFKQNIGN